ncbi:MAG: hypothetical protein R3D55_15685 [Chloroflexota bacterium]
MGKHVLPHYLRQQEPRIATIEVGAFARQLAKEAAKEAPKKYNTSAQDLAKYGAEYVIAELVQAISQSEEWRTNFLIITGIRTPAEVATLKALFGAKLLVAHVEIGQQSEADRLRDAPQDDTCYKTAEWADVILWNTGSLEQFYRQIDAKIVPHIAQSG